MKFSEIYHLEEAVAFKTADDVINSIKDGTIIKYLNGKKNFPIWIKDVVDGKVIDSYNIDTLKQHFEKVIDTIKRMSANNTSVKSNEAILLLIKKSDKPSTMNDIINNSIDTLVEYALSVKSEWIKHLASYDKLINGPYTSSIWHSFEKECQEKRTQVSVRRNKTIDDTQKNELYTVLYQDDNWVLCKPKNQAGDSELASHMAPFEKRNEPGKIITKAQWCTAAAEEYYRNYSEDGNGYYVIKTPGLFDAKNAWQIAFNGVNHVEFMNKYDLRNFYDGFISKAPDALLAKIVLDNSKHKYGGIVSLLDLKRAGFELKENTLDTDINGNKELDEYVLDKVMKGVNHKVAPYLKDLSIPKIYNFTSSIPEEYQEYFITQIGLDYIFNYRGRIGIQKDYISLFVDSSLDIQTKRALLQFFSFEDEPSKDFLKKILNIDEHNASSYTKELENLSLLPIVGKVLPKDAIEPFITSDLPLSEKRRFIQIIRDETPESTFKLDPYLLSTEQGCFIFHILLSLNLGTVNISSEVLQLPIEDLKSIFDNEFQSLPERIKQNVFLYFNRIEDLDSELIKDTIHSIKLMYLYQPEACINTNDFNIKNLSRFHLSSIEEHIKRVPNLRNYHSKTILDLARLTLMFNDVFPPDKSARNFKKAVQSIPTSSTIDWNIYSTIYSNMTDGYDLDAIPYTVIAQVIQNKNNDYTANNLDDKTDCINMLCEQNSSLKENIKLLCKLFKCKDSTEITKVFNQLSSSHKHSSEEHALVGTLEESLFKRIYLLSKM